MNFFNKVRMLMKLISSYENKFTELKNKKWWARGINSFYYLVITAVVIFFIIIYIDQIPDYGVDLFGFIAFLILFTYVFFGIKIIYRILFYTIIYIIYGKEFLLQESNQPQKYKYSRLLFRYLIFFTVPIILLYFVFLLGL